MTDLNKLYYEINKIYPLILISLGTLGNTFTFFIYTRAELNKTTTAFYFSCSALIDTLALYFGAFKFFLDGINGTNTLEANDFNCKFLTYTIYTLAEVSPWILVSVSVDRLFITFSPKISKKYNQNNF